MAGKTPAGSMPSGRVGIRDVARAAGVSAATVSQAYNGKGEVAAATRAHVFAIGDRLGYRPNPLGKALRSGRSRIIGVAISYRDSAVWEQTYMPYYRSIIAGAALEAVEHGYSIAATPSAADGSILAEIALDGLIVVDPVAGDAVVERGIAAGYAIVTDGGYPHSGDDARLRSVRSDMTGAMRRTFDHLRAGSTAARFRPALLIGPRVDAYTSDTIAGFQDWCAAHGAAPVVMGVGAGQSPLEAATALLAASDAPTAVHCLNETYSSAVLAAAAGRGLRVPDDLQVSVVGSARAVTAQRGVVYLDLDPVVTGARCARLLVAMLDGGPTADETHDLELIPAHVAN